MLGAAVGMAIFQIGKRLKEKVPNLLLRILIIVFITIIALTPFALFDYWLGGLIGLIIVTVTFFIIIRKKNSDSSNE
jgi:hypothetical protein